MKKSPRVTRIYIVDDDEASRRSLVELVESEFPKLAVHGFESLFECYRGLTCCDYLLLDVSSVAPLMLGDVSRAWAPISKYLQEYPRTELVICSAMGRNSVSDVMDDIVEQGGIKRDRLHYGGFLWEASESVAPVTIKKTLHNLIKPHDMEWTN